MTRLALLADLDRCTGCQACVVACKVQKQVPAGLSLIRLIQVGPEGDFPALGMYYLPLACQHCGRPACAESCPEGAIRRAENGVVTVEAGKCTGCGDCVGACPYGAVVLDAVNRLARKCDLCVDLLSGGGRPPCICVCPGKALQVLDLDDAAASAPVSGAGRRRRAERVALLPSAGTDPGGRFVLTFQEWQDRV
ncbi:MAG: 4Fe-4S binding protein [Actinomycetia bacterium]|nr:4Fe-4S binding protein [Actinomycetes bacterium]